MKGATDISADLDEWIETFEAHADREHYRRTNPDYILGISWYAIVQMGDDAFQAIKREAIRRGYVLEQDEANRGISIFKR